MKSKISYFLMVIIFLATLINFVNAQVLLQPVYPGVVQIGNMNINGIGGFNSLRVNNGTNNAVLIGITALPAYYYGLSAQRTYTSNTYDVYGIRGEATNPGSRAVYGGYFTANIQGTGVHYGINAGSYASSTTSTYGVVGLGSNAGSGVVYGGLFNVAVSGTGRHYGMSSMSYANSTNPSYGTSGSASNSGAGVACGGYFTTMTSGTGIHYGVLSMTYSNSTVATIGVSAIANNTGTGNVYGGQFETATVGSGEHYGIKATGASGANSTAPTIGVYGIGSSPSSAYTYGGYFLTAATGSGPHFGVRSFGYASSTAPTYGVWGLAENKGSGSAYAGYFDAAPSGTGNHYGVYAIEAAGGTGAAVYAAGDFVASGAKSAVVKTASGQRLFYAQESTENWFEDFGQAQLSQGKVQVQLDPDFLEAVTISSAHPMKVFVQLTSGDPVNVVIRKGTANFEVVSADPNSNATFDYRIVAKRKGYEALRMQPTTLGNDDPNLYPELKFEKTKELQEELERHERNQQQQDQHRQELEREQKEQEQSQESERQRQEQEQDRYQVEQAASVQATNQANIINLDELPDANLATSEANRLNQNHPNPFNPSTVIRFTITEPGPVKLKIFNTLGQEVATLLDQYLAAGVHEATFDAASLPSGIYFCRLSINGMNTVKRMELVK